MAYDVARGTWDGTRWTEVTTESPTPGQRRLHAMAYDANRQQLVLYGGAAPRLSGGTQVHDDTWEWDGARWFQVR
jgi:hypothetical protein